MDLSLEGCISQLSDKHGLSDTNPIDMPYRSGYLIDCITHDDIPPSQKASIVRQCQSMVGGINWVSQNTWPDITTSTTLSARHLQNPNAEHLDAARHVIKYLQSTPEWENASDNPNNPTLENMTLSSVFAVWLHGHQNSQMQSFLQ